MIYHGDLSKMKVQHTTPVRYWLAMNEGKVDMNQLLGQRIRIRFTGIIHCVSCGKVTKKAFGQGFCYSCFIKSPMNSECIIRPELCEGHLGKGRDPAWEEENHNKPHTVYLAQTNGIKVGVTRDDQVPVRWIDQGAWKAIPIAHTPYRQIAGKIEVFLKNDIPDKTPWQKMLKNEIDNTSIDLQAVKTNLAQTLPSELSPYMINEVQSIFEFTYPVLEYPKKINSLSPEKNPVIDGTLTGIRGQYLMLDYREVINLRSQSGFEIELTV